MSHCILPKRLRQLISVAARGLETPADAHAIYFLLLAQSRHTPPPPPSSSSPSSSSSSSSSSIWHLVCRSNTVPASSNPEWDPVFLADTNLPDHILATSQILIITMCCYNNEEKEVEQHHSTLTSSSSTISSSSSSFNNNILYTNTKDIPTVRLDLQSLQSADNALHLLQTALRPILLTTSTTTTSSSVVNAAWKLHLPHLHYLGDDLGALPHQLAPNSIILEYLDGYYTPSLPLLSSTSYDTDKKKGSESSSSLVSSSVVMDIKDIIKVGGHSTHQTTHSSTMQQQQRYSNPVKMKIKQIAAAAGDSNATNITIEGEGEDNMMSTEDEEVVEEGGTSSVNCSEVESRKNSNGTTYGGGGGKKLSLSQLQQSTVSLNALKERAADLRSVRDGKCRQLELLKSTSSKLKDQKAGLGALCQETQALKLRNEALQRKNAALQHQVTTVEQTIAARAQALATTLKVAQAADKRVTDARLAVAGEAGCERLVQVTRELVVRRCTLVCHVCKVMRLGTSSLSSRGGGAVEQQQPGTTNAVRRSHLSSSITPPHSSLTEVLEVGWAGAATPSITAGKPEYLKVDLTDTTANNNNKMNQALRHTNSHVSIKGKTTSTTNNNDHHQHHHHHPPVTMAVLSIGGLKVLDPEILRRIFTEEYMSSDPEPDEDKALSVALGYVALLVDRLATYLEIPCRYPIKLKGSVSSIMDGWESGGSWREEEVVVSRGLFSGWVGSGSSSGGGGGVQTVAAASQATRHDSGGGVITTSTTTSSTINTASKVRREYPLHSFGGIRERGRFAIGVFLLNKNVVQLLQMHGVGGGGASQLLGNLYKLLIAAKSAV